MKATNKFLVTVLTILAVINAVMYVGGEISFLKFIVFVGAIALLRAVIIYFCNLDETKRNKIFKNGTVIFNALNDITVLVLMWAGIFYLGGVNFSSVFIGILLSMTFLITVIVYWVEVVIPQSRKT